MIIPFYFEQLLGIMPRQASRQRADEKAADWVSTGVRKSFLLSALPVYAQEGSDFMFMNTS